MFCSVGSAHLDIFARQNGISGVDQKGDIYIAIGGTAYNVACNLKRYGSPVALVTVVKDSIFGNIILSRLKHYQINTDWIIEDPFIRESVFLSVTNSEDILYAVNSTVVEDFYITSFPDASAYFVDLNNSLETIRSVLIRNKPVYINLVSEDKSTKIIPILNLGESSCIKTISGNNREFERLRKDMMVDSIESLSLLYPWIEFIYTMGKEGLKVFLGGSIVCESAGMSFSRVDRMPKDISGAGDALMSGYMYGREFLEMSIKEAVEFSMNHAVLIKMLIPGANLMESNLIKNLDSVMHVDQLTGVYNRHYYERRKNRISENSSVIIIDIDRFKSINDTYGHSVGDDVLRIVASLIKQSVRQSDMIIRWGGEEFIIFYNGRLKDAVGTAERIREIVQSTPIKSKNYIINVTVSIGIAEITDVSLLNESIAKADSFLYKAKNSGRNRVEYLNAPSLKSEGTVTVP
ncbi:MAG: PfkB family carbohydrate kinase [Candidatus Omnitrophica bacterium]|nr:PfkB family carbohydrate kinase [Candidatus Omnitrophota bacterium]